MGGDNYIVPIIINSWNDLKRLKQKGKKRLKNSNNVLGTLVSIFSSFVKIF
jgi:hypothetical protein